MNYLLTMKFDGSSFHGWQRQDNADTVQQRLEEAIASLFGEKTSVTGCSRTDAGVHANDFHCNFRTDKELPVANVISGLNFFLPPQIAVINCKTVSESFNARFDCKSKEYVYKIYNSSIRDPFSIGRAYHYKYKLDENIMDEQAKFFLGTHDFFAFCAAGATVKTTVRTIKNADVSRIGDSVIFRVEADGFLYNMVRILTGTLIYIAAGKIQENTIPAIIESKDRKNAGITVPPDGLYLNKVYY